MKKTKKIKKPVWIAILCVSAAILIAAAMFLIRYFSQKDLLKYFFLLYLSFLKLFVMI